MVLEETKHAVEFVLKGGRVGSPLIFVFLELWARDLPEVHLSSIGKPTAALTC